MNNIQESIMQLEERIYTHDQLRLALLEQSKTGMAETLKRLESKIDTHFRWVMGSVSVLNLVLFGALMGAFEKISGWF